MQFNGKHETSFGSNEDGRVEHLPSHHLHRYLESIRRNHLDASWMPVQTDAPALSNPRFIKADGLDGLAAVGVGD